jgi:toxin YoeB
MGKFRVEIKPEAKKDLAKHFHSGNKAIIRKIEKILVELENHPETGEGQPEKLKYNLQGLWSRRINLLDRLIYSIQNDIVKVEVLSAMGHYSDK